MLSWVSYIRDLAYTSAVHTNSPHETATSSVHYIIRGTQKYGMDKKQEAQSRNSNWE